MTGSFTYKGMVDSVKDLVLMENQTVGDAYVTRYDGTAYVWSGSQWVRMDPNNVMRTVRMDYPNVEKETSDFESNLKKLEKKTLELQQREKYYGGSALYQLSEKTKELTSSIEDMSNVIDNMVVKPVENLGNSIYSYIEDIYNNWNTALAESGK